MQTRGLLPTHPRDPEEVFATTGVPPLTVMDTDLAAEAVVGMLRMTLAVTVIRGPMFACSSGETSGDPGTPPAANDCGKDGGVGERDWWPPQPDVNKAKLTTTKAAILFTVAPPGARQSLR